MTTVQVTFGADGQGTQAALPSDLHPDHAVRMFMEMTRLTWEKYQAEVYPDREAKEWWKVLEDEAFFARAQAGIEPAAV